MNKEMQKKRVELAAHYSREDLTVKEDFISGFNAAHDLMQERIKEREAQLLQLNREFADYQNSAHEKEKMVKGLVEMFKNHLTYMEAINAHLGYQFTQPLMKAREALKGRE